MAGSYTHLDVYKRQIVGRCANFILKGRPNLFSVFLHADRATRMQRVTENYGVKPGGAAKAMDLICLLYTSSCV